MTSQETSAGSHGGHSRRRLGGFIKEFVHDIKTFKKDSFRHRRHSKVRQEEKPNQLPQSDVTPKQPTTNDAGPVAGPRSLFQDVPHVRTLSVRVTVNFGDPLSYSHSQDYEASSSLQPTEELCEALLHRVDHCSKELITRKDSKALERTGWDGLAKPLRYEIQVQILRKEAEAETDVWATRVVRSYQRQPLETESAREIILSTHHMIGLFLRRHDEAFVWKDGPVREDVGQEQKTYPYRPGRVQPLASVPPSTFAEKQQQFTSIPGYTVTFTVTSRNHRRVPAVWHESVEVHSRQLSPLIYTTAENLFFDVCYAADGVFRSERKAIEADHASCTDQQGCGQCKPCDGDGIDIVASVRNNVGPLFDNLERTICAKANIVWKRHAEDSGKFVDKIRTALEKVCQETDDMVSGMYDFEFSIVELRGRGWSIDEPLVFTRGPDTFISRRDVEAVLDRLQTGVADSLRGNAIAVRMTARKRGHFILDKTLVSREPVGRSAKNKTKSAAKSKSYVIDRLRQRIENDIEMVCRDTCSLACRERETDSVTGTFTLASKDHPSLRTALTSTKQMSLLSAASIAETVHTHDQQNAALEPVGSELSVKSEPLVLPSYVSPSQWPGVARDPETGLRQFPLDPQSWATQQELDPIPHDTLPIARPTMELSTLPASDKGSTTQNNSPSESDVSQNEQESGGVPLKFDHYYERPQSRTEASSTVSTRPRTPSLEFGGSPSIRSSLLVTPKLHEPVASHRLEFLQRLMPDMDDKPYHATELVDSYMRKLFKPTRSNSTPSLKLHLRDFTAPVATHHSEVNYRGDRADEGLPHSEERIPTGCISLPAVPTAEQLSIPSVPTNLVLSSEVDSESKDEIEPIKEPESFSQSKLDYAFSSPATATSPETSPRPAEEIEKNRQHQQTIPQPSASRDIRVTTPEPSDTNTERSVVLARPTTPRTPPLRPRLSSMHHPRTSMGSAGYLGSFHDQLFQGIGGFRQALVGASTPPPRPFSPPRFGAGAAEPKRPGTAV
ncbi:hypothetical protein F5Y17DRAFT_429756 [Xylariaceae sp. FL0594]|nr:hypothetical protein F5Y17DRAFT_429756 [Xylariaceae sp. FL0594]